MEIYPKRNILWLIENKAAEGMDWNNVGSKPKTLKKSIIIFFYSIPVKFVQKN